MSRWDRYVLRPRVWMETSRSEIVPHIGPYNEMMINYYPWHTTRSPTGRKVNYVEEISSLNEKVDLIMSLLSKQAPIDPHDVPLNSLVAQEKEEVDVNFI